MSMGVGDINAIMEAIGELKGELRGINANIADIKAGNMPTCVSHGEALKSIQRKLNDPENGSDNGHGMKMELLRGMFSLSNISPSRATAVAKVGRDLAFGAMLVYLFLRMTGTGPTVEWKRPEALVTEAR